MDQTTISSNNSSIRQWKTIANHHSQADINRSLRHLGFGSWALLEAGK